MKSQRFYDYTVYEDGTITGKTGREVKKRIKNGRYEVRLNVNRKREHFILARLVYHVFYAKPGNDNPFDITDKNQCITHKDGDKLNVHRLNLKVVPRKSLIQGEGHTRRTILTDQEVAEIQKRYVGASGTNQYDKTSPSLQELANQYGVSKSNIAAIIKGRSRKADDYKLK